MDHHIIKQYIYIYRGLVWLVWLNDTKMISVALLLLPLPGLGLALLQGEQWRSLVCFVGSSIKYVTLQPSGEVVKR